MELEIKRFDAPDETRAFDKGSFEVVEIGGMTIGRARYEPGWKWSEHVGRDHRHADVRGRAPGHGRLRSRRRVDERRT